MIDKKAANEISSFFALEGDTLVVSHYSPDGDSIGCLLAMGSILDQLYCRNTLAIDDECPNKYKFMPGFESIVNLKNTKLPKCYEKTIILDAGALARVGKANEYINDNTRILNIDHHFTGKFYGNINYIDVDASATAELIYDLCSILELDITPQIAYGIYVGIITDTGRFRFSNTNDRALQICGEMIERGVDPVKVTENLFFNMPIDVIRSLGWGLSNLSLYMGGVVSILHLDKEHNVSNTEGFVEYATSVEKVLIGIFICETKENEFKISIRSRCSVNVSEIAKKLGGGGHRKAAGFQFEGEYKDLKELLLDEIGLEMQKRNILDDSKVLSVLPLSKSSK